jgi:hypothetical protein
VRSKSSGKLSYRVFSQRRNKVITKEARAHHGKVSFKLKSNIFPIMEGFSFVGVEKGDMLQLQCVQKPELKFDEIDLASYNLVTDVTWKRVFKDEEEEAKGDFEGRYDSVKDFLPTIRSEFGSLRCEESPWRLKFRVVHKEEPGIALDTITVRTKARDDKKTAKERRRIQRELEDLLPWPPASEEEE